MKQGSCTIYDTNLDLITST
uniref:Uncharacterized protein n=1 Tax=Anguilla anguilla TaxID=7936 RepID=A0A0E9TKZ5_ANGAN